MSEIARWAGHVFEVSPSLVRSFNTLTVKAGIETDDMEAGTQRYIARQAGKAAELSFSIPLSGFMGVDVRTEAMQFIDEARRGVSDYFYIGGSKLMTCQLMLTEASVSETEIGGGGKWTGCKVKLTMKQSSKFDGEEGDGHKVENGSSTGYAETDEERGLSGNKKSVKPDAGNGGTKGIFASLKEKANQVSTVSKTVNSALADIKRITAKAKAGTTATKTIRGSWANNKRG